MYLYFQRCWYDEWIMYERYSSSWTWEAEAATFILLVKGLGKLLHRLSSNARRQARSPLHWAAFDEEYFCILLLVYVVLCSILGPRPCLSSMCHAQTEACSTTSRARQTFEQPSPSQSGTRHFRSKVFGLKGFR